MTGLATEPAVLDFDDYRRELTGYCYRMLGSAFDAEDAVQETMVRAWRGQQGFEGRSAVRSWLYRIATNVSLDMLKGRQRRAMPMDLSSTAWQPVEASLADPLPSQSWVEPVPDSWCLPATSDPAEAAVARESIRLAFVAALQLLPPRQRAVLILRDVLRWKADEVASLLDSSVASVNSALQRARATLAEKDLDDTGNGDALDEEHRELLARYVDAFERYDMDSLTALLHEDAAWSMPPYELWLRGHDVIRWWCLGPGSACRGSRLVATRANGSPAFGHYKPDPEHGGHSAWSLQVLETRADRISAITFFLDTERFFPLFDLPLHLPD